MVTTRQVVALGPSPPTLTLLRARQLFISPYAPGAKKV